MRSQCALGLAVLTVFVLVQAQDVGVLLMDQRLVQREISCILERGPCDAIGKQIKGLLPEALNNNCQRCTSQQARNARKLIEFMRSNYPNEWRIIVQRYGAKSNYPA